MHFLRPSDLFVDVGANAGSYTVLASRVAGATAIAVEPIRSTAERLRANVSLNGISERVMVVECAVGAISGEALMTYADDTTNRVVTKPCEGSNCIAVETRTLDDICRSREPKLIKIDVEGHALAVLAGADQTLKNPSLCALIVELGESDVREASVRLRKYGFRAVT